MSRPYKLDPDKVCSFCGAKPLRVPLVFNGTDPKSGKYWCADCDVAETAQRIARHLLLVNNN